jgi:O-succinylbenzoic acid--CoA ligase
MIAAASGIAGRDYRRLFVRRLVPLRLPGGPAFVEALRRAWDDGDAVLPVDTRLSPAAVDRLVASMHLDEPVEDGDALVVATSGTSGEPKGVVLTHDAVRASAVATSARLGVGAGDTWLACLPLAHVGGLSVVTRALVTGTRLVVHDGFDADAVHSAVRDDGVTLVSLVTTALRRVDAAWFRVVVLGGSAPPEELAPNVVTTYGMTETGSGVVYDGFPLDGVDVKVDDRGQIHLRGPMLLRAYRDGDDPKDAAGWLATGDVGELDAVTGRLRVHGRATDLIISGGENVWPDAVEAVLAADVGVREVAVVGRPDEEWGQRVVAVIVPVDRERPPPLDRLRALVKERIGPWAAPRELQLVDALPRTALGKLRRRQIAAEHQTRPSAPTNSTDRT